MTAAGARLYRNGRIVAIIVRFRIDDRPPRLGIDTFCPGDRRKRLSRDERSRHAVEYVKEAVLIGLHDDLALAPVDGKVG